MNEYYEEAIDEIKEAIECLEDAVNNLQSAVNHLDSINNRWFEVIAYHARDVQTVKDCLKAIAGMMD